MQGQNADRSTDLAPLLEALSITKQFGDVVANRDVSLTVFAGEKLALLGENGAGKSTFVKILNGLLRPDAGSIRWQGKEVAVGSPATARRLGIGMVFQHFSSFEALTVGENIAIALPHLSRSEITETMGSLSKRYGLEIDARRRVESLSAGEKQRVEIVRALLQEPKLLILDEPTSVLTPQEADGLFSTLDALTADGMAVIYISHRLSEIEAFCDRATVLRHGEVVATCDPRTAGASAMAEMMIGSVSEPIRRENAFVGGARLEVTKLSMSGQGGTDLTDVTFKARRGEILAIAGVAGEGQNTLYMALSGERRTRKMGAIKIDGTPVGSLGPTSRRRLGAAFAPEQRLGHAAIGDLSLSENLRLTRHSLRGSGRSSLRSRAKAIRERFDVRSGKGDPKAGTLSGGNLQKFVIGREIDRDPGVFVVAQPTWGVDAGAAASIRAALMELSANGAAVVVISQDLDEVFQIADRVAVMHGGALSDIYPIGVMTSERIGLLMAGQQISLDDDDAAPAAETSEAPSQEVAPAPVAAVEEASGPEPRLPPPTPAPVQQRRRGLRISGTISTPWTPREQFQKNGSQA